MNILQINKFFWHKGGSEAVFFGEGKLLEESGHNIVPFSMHDTRNYKSEYDRFFVSNVDYNDKGLWRQLKSAGRVVYSIEANRKIKQLLSEVDIDIAHFHIFQHQITTSVFAPLIKKGIPLVLTLHDLKPICPNYKMYTNGQVCEKCKGSKFYNCFLNKCTKGSRLKSFVNMFEMYAHKVLGYYKKVDKYIAVSKFYKRKMVEFGLDENSIVYMPNFIGEDKIRYGNAQGDYVLYFGRLSIEKGLDTLINAAGYCPEIEFKIVGTGDEKNRLEKLVTTLNLKNVSFLGYKTGVELDQLLDNCRFTVITSEWYENCPMSVLESLAVGKAVIGADIGGISELINEGKDGYLYKAGDVRQLAEKITKLWGNIDQCINFGVSGREKIISHHSEKRHLERLSNLYISLQKQKSL